jgi:hypothetical protein
MAFSSLPSLSASALRSWTTGLLAAALLAAGLFVTGCDDESLMPPEPTDDLFARYVSLGNSITAGFQSGGITASSQQDSYAALLAAQMGTRFEIPALQSPGCPPPLTQLFPPEGAGETACALRTPESPPFVNNVAVPNAKAVDALTNTAPRSSANTLTQLILGGRTQVGAAADVDPTFASVWLGNNDVLEAASAGVPQLATPTGQFESDVGAVLDSLEQAGADHGVVVGVVDVAGVATSSAAGGPVSLVPSLAPGRFYFGLQNSQAGAQLPDNFEVAGTCAPNAQSAAASGDTTRVAFTRFLALVGQAQATPSATVTLDCSDDQGVLGRQESQKLSERVAAYNAALASAAQERGWAFYDPNPDFRALAQAGLVPPAPALAPPLTDQYDTPFGPVFSLDGTHPSSLAHEVVASRLTQTINQTDAFDAQLPSRPLPEAVAPVLGQ